MTLCRRRRRRCHWQHPQRNNKDTVIGGKTVVHEIILMRNWMFLMHSKQVWRFYRGNVRKFELHTFIANKLVTSNLCGATKKCTRPLRSEGHTVSRSQRFTTSQKRGVIAQGGRGGGHWGSKNIAGLLACINCPAYVSYYCGYESILAYWFGLHMWLCFWERTVWHVILPQFLGVCT